MEGGKGGMKAGRPTYGDAVVTREPDSYKLPHKEAKSCWEGSTRGGMHGGGGGERERIQIRRREESERGR